MKCIICGKEIKRYILKKNKDGIIAYKYQICTDCFSKFENDFLKGYYDYEVGYKHTGN